MIFPRYTPAPPTGIDHLADLLLLGAGLAILLFTLLYGCLSHWRATPGGISVMLFTSSLDLLLALIIVGKFQGGEYPYRDVVRLLVYGYVLVTSLLLVINLLLTWFSGNYAIYLKTRMSKISRDQGQTEQSYLDGIGTEATK